MLKMSREMTFGAYGAMIGAGGGERSQRAPLLERCLQRVQDSMIQLGPRNPERRALGLNGRGSVGLGKSRDWTIGEMYRQHM